MEISSRNVSGLQLSWWHLGLRIKASKVSFERSWQNVKSNGKKIVMPTEQTWHPPFFFWRKCPRDIHCHLHWGSFVAYLSAPHYIHYCDMNLAWRHYSNNIIDNAKPFQRFAHYKTMNLHKELETMLYCQQPFIWNIWCQHLVFRWRYLLYHFKQQSYQVHTQACGGSNFLASPITMILTFPYPQKNTPFTNDYLDGQHGK